ncbi:hypothetical protein CARUB_v10021783mg [Capsella rubella]|uniref:SWIM-type domain-containing protein n=1 Tax=Capsella rubella TaxID=81985 RepID=R0HWN9_9BRAS|nr:hypothetical protein CARUB_v10021783mg [Capsella rubella]
METLRETVTVLCYTNCSIKYGPDGVYYEGSTPKKVRFRGNTELSTLLDGLYPIFGLDKQRSKISIFGRLPVVVSPQLFTYVHFPVVNDSTLEIMLEVSSNHPSVKDVELYLEVKSTSDDASPAARSSPLENSGSSLKRQRTQQPKEGVQSSASNPWSLSSLWVDDHELRVGLCFKGRDELKKAVDWCSIRGRQKFVVRETEKDAYTFECIRWKCKWSLRAARMEEHGLVEITEFNSPHTCCPIGSDNFDVEFAAEEIECLIRVQPTLTVAELKDWWFEKFGDVLETSVMQAAKQEVIKKVFGDWDRSFRVLPKLMAAFHSSNGLLVDWQYDLFPDPEFASFRGVFWAFQQSIEGFRHCRPLIIVDIKDLNGKYPMKLMIASGVEADDCHFPLAFAVTTEESSDSWRWFLTEIREKVTQRKGICLISSSHPDILAVINEPGSRWQEPWAYHRFCLDFLCSRFHNVFQDDYLKNLVYEAGSTSQKEEFDSYMNDIKKNNREAQKWLDQFPQNKWAQAHDSGRRYGVMTTDTENVFAIFESVQSLGLPVTANILLLFDEMRLFFNTGLCDSRGRVNRGDMYIKTIMEKLEELMTDSITHVIMPLEKGVFQVSEPLKNDEWVVRLNECTCTCGKFQSKKFPCLHALAVCEKLKINPLQYVDDYYTLERLHKTYAATFSPVPEVSAWPEASGVPTLFPPVILPQPNVSGKSIESLHFSCALS